MMTSMPPPPKPGWFREYFTDLLEPATYRALLYHALAFPLALTYFIACVVMLVLGLGLLVIFVGLPILIGGLSMMRGFAALERTLGNALLGVKLSQPRPLLRPDTVWASGRQMLSDAGTYKTLLYLFLKFPFSLVMFILTLTLLSISLCLMLVPPLTLFWQDMTQVMTDSQIYSLTPLSLVAVTLAGIALLVLSLTVLNALSRAWAFLSMALLTDFGEGVQAQLEVQALRQGARTIAYHGDLPSTLSELLAQGVQATAARGGLVWQQSGPLAQHGLEGGNSSFSSEFSIWHAQAKLNPDSKQVFLNRAWSPDSKAWGTLLSVVLRVQEEPHAELHVVYPAQREPSQRELEFWVTIGHQMEVALETAQLVQRAERLGGEQERSRLARELHDSVAQALFGISLGARAARAQFEQDPARAAQNLDYTVNLADGATREMKSLLFALRPDALEEGGLATALEGLIEVLKVRYQLEGTAHIPVEPDLEGTQKGALYRIAQEAVHNVVKHARAKSVQLSLLQENEVWVLRVSDDGGGFDAAQIPGGTLGLKSMRERAREIGATLELNSLLGKGTALTVCLPILP
jgi:signal transduction histidine kinase